MVRFQVLVNSLTSDLNLLTILISNSSMRYWDHGQTFQPLWRPPPCCILSSFYFSIRYRGRELQAGARLAGSVIRPQILPHVPRALVPCTDISLVIAWPGALHKVCHCELFMRRGDLPGPKTAGENNLTLPFRELVPSTSYFGT